MVGGWQMWAPGKHSFWWPLLCLAQVGIGLAACSCQRSGNTVQSEPLCSGFAGRVQKEEYKARRAKGSFRSGARDGRQWRKRQMRQ